MFIRRLTIENFMRVVGVSIEPNGKHVMVRGENGSGKTSVVEAIWDALCGSDSKARPEPVRKGASKGRVSLDLGDYQVEKVFSPDGSSRLVIKASDGKKILSPQKLLDGLLTRYSLDPVAFLDRRPQDQLDDVLEVCGITPPVEAVEKIIGEPAKARPGESAFEYMERLSADEVGEWYVRRRLVHRDVETNAGAVAKQKQLVESLGSVSVDAGRDTEAINKDLSQAIEQKRAFDAAAAELNRMEDKRVAGERKIADLAALHSDVHKSVIDLENRLYEARKQLEDVFQRMKKGGEYMAALEAEIAAAARACEAAKPTRDIAALQKELETASTRSEKDQEIIIAGKRLADLEQAHENSKRLHLATDQKLEALRDLRKSLLNGADLGVKGLEVGDSELMLNGVSFKQASLAERLGVAFAVAMKGNGALKLLRIDNGEHLDSVHREHLLSLADKYGFQVVMTCVSDDSELKLEIVDQKGVA